MPPGVFYCARMACPKESTGIADNLTENPKNDNMSQPIWLSGDNAAEGFCLLFGKGESESGI